MAPVDGYRHDLPGQPHSGDDQPWAVFCSRCLNEVIEIVRGLPERLPQHTCGGQLDATPILSCRSCGAGLAYFSGETVRRCRAGKHEPPPSYEWAAR